MLCNELVEQDPRTLSGGIEMEHCTEMYKCKKPQLVSTGSNSTPKKQGIISRGNFIPVDRHVLPKYFPKNKKLKIFKFKL